MAHNQNHNRKLIPTVKNLDDKLNKSNFITNSIATEVKRNGFSAREGSDRANMESLQAVGMDRLTKSSNKPITVRRKRFHYKNKTHNNVNLLQQAGANYGSELNKYNTRFQSQSQI